MFICRTLRSARALSFLALGFISLPTSADQQSVKSYTPKLIVNKTSASYKGDPSLIQIMQTGQAIPLALSAGDFNEDGIEDLVTGYGTSRSGIVALYPGKQATIHSNTNGLRPDSPFTSSAFLFGIPERSDFLESGDFDNDGHWDVAYAASRSNAFYLLSGDGNGNFPLMRKFNVPGIVTTLVAGEINRSDGLMDLILGVSDKKGASVLVYDSPDGALNSRPEVIPIPAPATEIRLGLVDQDYFFDLAVASGKDLVVIHGRDRGFIGSNDDMKPAIVERHTMTSDLRSLALLDYEGDRIPDIATLTADGIIRKMDNVKQKEEFIPIVAESRGDFAEKLIRVRMSASPGDDLIAFDQNKLHLIIGDSWKHSPSGHRPLPVTFKFDSRPVAALAMHLNGDTLSDLIVLQSGSTQPVALISQPNLIFTVDSNLDNPDEAIGDGECTFDDGITCSLRAAIQEANASPGPDSIQFSISGTIHPATDYPLITEAVTINGGGNITLLADNVTNGFLVTAPNTTIQNLSVNSCVDRCIFFTPANNGLISNVKVQGSNFNGFEMLDSSNGTSILNSSVTNTGEIAVRLTNGSVTVRNTSILNTHFGLFLENLTNSVIGGTGATQGNTMQGIQGSGISMSSAPNSLIQRNLISNNGGFGIEVDTSDTTIGGTASGAGNVIESNDVDGIIVCCGAIGVSILGNDIGKNGGFGIGLDGANHNQAAPLLGSATIISGTTTIEGTLTSSPNQTFRIEFFKNSACDPFTTGEGETFLNQFKNVTTGGNGTVNFSFSTTSVNSGDVITATATKMAGSDPTDTSQFSNCVTVSGGTNRTLSISDAGSINEGNSGTKTAQFRVTLSPAPTSTVTVDFATADGTATVADGDYSAKSGTLSFGSGATSKTISVTVNGDTQVESDEQFTVHLSNANGGNATISKATGTAKIVNDDGGGGTPEIDVSTEPIDLGQIAIGTFKQFKRQISNSGTGTLTVTIQDHQALVTSPSGTFDIIPGSSVSLIIKGVADTEGAIDHELVLTSNDPDEQEIRIPVQGTGIVGNTGAIDVSQDSGIAKNTVMTTGVQWTDVNNDNKLDLFLSGKNGNALFQNLDGKKFKNITKASKLGSNGKEVAGASWADVDNDGDVDVLLAVTNSGPSLFLNNGRGVFSAARNAFGPSAARAAEGRTLGGIWLDFDQDGMLDMFVIKDGASNLLFRQFRRNEFEDITSTSGVAFTGPSRSAVAADFNQDGFIDIYLVLFNAPNKLYLNSPNGKFTEAPASTGAAFKGAAVRAVVADFDADGDGNRPGDPDIFIVNSNGRSALLRNDLKNGSLKFTNVTRAFRLTKPKKGVSAAFSDVDNDGDLDLIVVQEPGASGGNMLFTHNGKKGTAIRFKRIRNVDLNNADNPTGMTLGDFDNDGLVDTVVGDAGENQDNGDSLYKNTGGGENNCLQVVLEGSDSNRSACGATVSVTIANGLISMLREITCGDGQNQGSLSADFGLETSDSVAIQIFWPSGADQTFQNVPANQRIKVKEGGNPQVIQSLNCGSSLQRH